jgi:hypothetical protein
MARWITLHDSYDEETIKVNLDQALVMHEAADGDGTKITFSNDFTVRVTESVKEILGAKE